MPEPLIRFLEENVLDYRETNGWALALQGELRRAYASLVAAQLQQGRAPDARTARHIEQLSRDFFGTVGLLEGALSNPHGYDARAAVQLLERLREQLPLDSPKRYQSRFFTLRALLREQQRDQQGATADLEVAVSIWPVRNNPAVQALTDAYIKQGRHDAVTALNARIVR